MQYLVFLLCLVAVARTSGAKPPAAAAAANVFLICFLFCPLKPSAGYALLLLLLLLLCVCLCGRSCMGSTSCSSKNFLPRHRDRSSSGKTLCRLRSSSSSSNDSRISSSRVPLAMLYSDLRGPPHTEGYSRGPWGAPFPWVSIAALGI